MSKFTKGDWYALGGGVASTNADHLICGFNGLNDEQEANAALISAAPEMYEALTELVKLRCESTIDCPYVKMAEKALAKAQGNRHEN